MTNADSLRQKIEAAWRDMPYPGDAAILDPSINGDDDGIPAYFAGTTWHGHTFDALRAHTSGLSAYFAPAA